MKLVVLTHLQCLPVYRKMYTHFKEDVHLKLEFKFTSLIAHFVIEYLPRNKCFLIYSPLYLNIYSAINAFLFTGPG